jgi:hypothetical protein
LFVVTGLVAVITARPADEGRESVAGDRGENAVEVLPNHPVQSEEEPAKRDFGDLARILSIANAKPQAVDLSGSYSGKRRRSTDDDVVIEEREPQTETAAEPAQRDFGDLARILSIANAKPQPIEPGNRSYSGRRRRSDDNLHGLVAEVALDAVKIKPHGKNGNHVQNSGPRSAGSRSIFEPSYTRVKRADFVSFTEYDQRRVKTLKIEQNDFLALPKRLEQEEEQTDRQKRKFVEE